MDGRITRNLPQIARSTKPCLWMDALKDVTYLDALLLMCLHYQDLPVDDTGRMDALQCIHDCERRQMELRYHG